MSIDWGAVAAVIGVVAFVLPWVLKMHSSIAVTENNVKRIEAAMNGPNGIPGRCVSHEEQIKGLRSDYGDHLRFHQAKESGIHGGDQSNIHG